MQFASYFRPFPSMAGAMCGLALVLSGCGDSKPPDAEPPSPAPAVAQQSPEPASGETKTSAAKATVTHGGAGEMGSLADLFAARKDFGGLPDKKTDGRSAGSVAPSEKPAEPKQVSDADAKALFAEFDKAILSGSAAGIRATVYYQVIVDKALNGVEISDEIKRSFAVGIMKGFEGPEGFAGHLADHVSKGEKYHLVRTRKILGRPTALYRHFDTKNRMGYSEFIAGLDTDGKAKIIDVYRYGGDEYESDHLRREIISQAARENAEFAKTLTEEQRLNSEHEKEIEELHRNYDEEKYEDVILCYDKLPKILRESRHILPVRIGATHKKKYLCDGLVKLFRDKYPGDHGLDGAMPGYLATGDHWKEALAAIDLFDHSLGGDPYLDAQRAGFQLQMGNFALAKKLIANAAKVEPDDKLVKDIRKEVRVFDKDLAGESASDGPAAPPAAGAEAKEFVAAFLKLIEAGDEEAIGKCLDTASFYRRASAGVDVPHRLRLGIEASFRAMESKYFASVFKIGRDELDRGASYSLLRLHVRGDDHCAMFRHISQGGGFRYVDCVLVHDADGSVRIADYMELEMGMMESQLDSYMLIEEVRKNKDHMEDDDKSPPGPSSPETEDPKTLAGVVEKMRQMYTTGRDQDALAYYDKLSVEWQKDQAVMVYRLLAARRVKGDAYDKALREYYKTFPDAINFNALAIEYYQDAKKYDGEISRIRGVNSAISAAIGKEDPYLDVICAEASLGKKDVNTAKRLAKKAVDADPTLHQGYKLLLSISLSQKKYTETSQLLNAFKKQCPAMAPNVEGDAEYAEFAKSPAGKSWIKQHK